MDRVGCRAVAVTRAAPAAQWLLGLTALVFVPACADHAIESGTGARPNGDASHASANDTGTPLSGGEPDGMASPEGGRSRVESSSTEPVLAISAGTYHTCGIRLDGSVVCWGSNAHRSAAAAPSEMFSSVSAGAFFNSCGIRDNSNLACWGPEGSFETMATYLQVDVDYPGGCAVASEGSLFCFGASSDLGNPPPGPHVVVAVGTYHGCATTPGGAVDCWGAFAPTTQGPSTPASHDFGQATPPSGNFTAVTAAALYTCGLRADQTVQCWGSAPPALVGQYLQISAGSGHLCGVALDGTVACTGADAFGQATPPAGQFSSVSAGGTHCCGLREDKTVVCWGDDEYHQTTLPSDFP